MSRKALLIATAGLVLAGGAVVAVSAPGDRMGHFRDGAAGPVERHDWGHEMRGRFGGALTREQFDTRTRERFARLDRNSDGVIDQAEIEAAINDRMTAHHGWFGRSHAGAGPDQMDQRMLHRLGAGADGKLTRELFRAEIASRFDEVDLNGDGRIDDSDLPPPLRGRNILGQFGQPGAHGGGAMRWLAMLGVTARDGAIGRDDVLSAADKQFERLDRNKDGVVDKADMDLARKDMLSYRVQRFAHRFGAGADGRITREQFEAKAARQFARLDVNGDGTITRDERHQLGWGGGRHGQRGHHRHGPYGMTDHGGPAAGDDTAPPAASPPKN